MKKSMLGTSDAWSTSYLSHQPSEPAYYIVDCRIFLDGGAPREKLRQARGTSILR